MNYRNRDLLDLAKHAPHCMLCGKPNDGDVVAMHSNSHIHGKGAMLKAGDNWSAFGCMSCHTRIDQGPESREERQVLWLLAHIATMNWLWSTGKICVAAEFVREDRPEPVKRKVLKSRPIAGRGFDKRFRKKMSGIVVPATED